MALSEHKKLPLEAKENLQLFKRNFSPVIRKIPVAFYDGKFLPLSEKHVVTMRAKEEGKIGGLLVLGFNEQSDFLTMQKLDMENVEVFCTQPQQQTIVGVNIRMVHVWQRKEEEINKIAQWDFLTEAELQALGSDCKITSVAYCGDTDFICVGLHLPRASTAHLYLFNIKNGTKHKFQLPDYLKLSCVCFIMKNGQPKLITAELGHGVFSYDLDFEGRRILNRTLIKNVQAMHCVVDPNGDYLAIYHPQPGSSYDLLVWPLFDECTMPEDPTFDLYIRNDWSERPSIKYYDSYAQFLSDGSLLFRTEENGPCLAVELHKKNGHIYSFDEYATNLCCLPGDQIALFTSCDFKLYPRHFQRLYLRALDELDLNIYSNETMSCLQNQTPFSTVCKYFHLQFFQPLPKMSIAVDKSARTALIKTMEKLTRQLPSEHPDKIVLTFFCEYAKNDATKSIHRWIRAAKGKASEVNPSRELMLFLDDLKDKFQEEYFMPTFHTDQEEAIKSKINSVC